MEKPLYIAISPYIIGIAGAGFEPTTFGLWARRATELLHPALSCSSANHSRWRLYYYTTSDSNCQYKSWIFLIFANTNHIVNKSIKILVAINNHRPTYWLDSSHIYKSHPMPSGSRSPRKLHHDLPEDGPPIHSAWEERTVKYGNAPEAFPASGAFWYAELPITRKHDQMPAMQSVKTAIAISVVIMPMTIT